MNFERDEPFDQQLGRLLAIIILFERKIETLRKKLVGNEDFHTRLVFQKLDHRKKGQVKPQDFLYVVSERDRQINLPMCQSFCRKYSTTGALNYNEFLNIISPKTDQILSQRLMMRISKRGATLPHYLWVNFQQLLCNIITMTNLTERIRKSIQITSDLSYLEMVQFFRKCLHSKHSIYSFCNQNSQQQYDFQQGDVKYISLHVRSANQVQEMTDQDIKQLICPLQLNFSKPVLQMAGYFETLKNQMKKTVNTGMGTFQKDIKPKNYHKTSTNFLNANYQKTFTNNFRENQPINTNYNMGWQNKNISKKQPVPDRQYMIPNVNVNEQPRTSNMYLDNFMKMPSSGRQRMDLDDYLSRRRSIEAQNFVDQLEGNNLQSDVDQSQSAFYRY